MPQLFARLEYKTITSFKTLDMFVQIRTVGITCNFLVRQN